MKGAGAFGLEFEVLDRRALLDRDMGDGVGPVGAVREAGIAFDHRQLGALAGMDKVARMHPGGLLVRMREEKKVHRAFGLGVRGHAYHRPIAHESGVQLAKRRRPFVAGWIAGADKTFFNRFRVVLERP